MKSYLTDYEKSPKRELGVEIANHLFLGSTPALLTACVIAVLLVLSLWETGPHVTMIVWLVALVLVYALRIVVAREYQSLRPSDPGRWLIRFRVGTAISGIVWGIGVLLLFPASDVIGESLLAFFVAGLAAGAAMAYVVDSVSVIAFNIPLVC